MKSALLQIILTVFLAVGLWSAYEYSKMPYSLLGLTPQIYQSEIPPQFQNFTNPKLFDNAKIISDANRLKYPEDIVVDNAGNIYAGLFDGRIVKITPQGQILDLAELKGNLILGIILTKDQKTLYFVTQFEGLCRMSLETNKIQVLVKEFEGKNLVTLNSLTIDEVTQTIYFTQISSITPFRYVNKQLLLKTATGRVFEFNLTSNELSVLIAGLYFPNGIVYQNKTKSVIVAELNRYQIIRVYTEGENKGEKATILSNLIGLPDNIKLDQNGELLVALPSTRDLILGFFDRSPTIRKIFMYFPESILIKAANTKYAGGIRVNLESGQITEYLLGGNDKIYLVSTILEKNGKIYFSSFKNPTILVIDSLQPKRPVEASETKTEEL